MTKDPIRDGSAGDVNYGTFGAHYSSFRQPDPQIARLILEALGSAQTVLNVGAGSGSYEPTDRIVTAIEPSESMRNQRPTDLSIAIAGSAESLPFPDNHFEASMATFTIHQWGDLTAGLREMRRVTDGPIVILSCDPKELDSFWLIDYAPEVIYAEARRYPSINHINKILGSTCEVIHVPIPLNCRDGFNAAYYGRPEMLLNPAARSACSAWSFLTSEQVDRAVCALKNDLDTGLWDAKYGFLRTQPNFIGSLKLIRATK